jgi:hypothetical protein
MSAFSPTATFTGGCVALSLYRSGAAPERSDWQFPAACLILSAHCSARGGVLRRNDGANGDGCKPSCPKAEKERPYEQ